MCIPILSLFFGSLIWHEALTLNILIGAAFICLGIVMSSLKMKVQKNRLAYSGNQQR